MSKAYKFQNAKGLYFITSTEVAWIDGGKGLLDIKSHNRQNCRLIIYL